MNSARLLALPLVLLAACDRSGTYLVPQQTDVPPVLELGELDVVTEIDWASTGASFATYADVGAPEPGAQSGVTFTFRGTGDKVCVVVDPEAVYWNRSVAATSPSPTYSYPDNYLDDGDLDLYVGLSANYTGSPGIELGDFEGQYTDSLGNVVTIEYNLCETTGYYGQTPAHAGRATVEYCTIDTEGREGIEYTVLLKTFSLPIDDSILSFATVVYEGSCRNIDECTLPGESGAELLDEGGNRLVGFDELEEAYCSNEMNAFCEAWPEMCGDP